MNYKEKFASAAARIPEIYFPAEEIDLSRFSCIACDQYSAQSEYWHDVEVYAGSSPSSLYMMMPEAWLGKRPKHQEAIPFYMDKYLRDGSLKSLGEGLIYIERETGSGIRKGLLIALDLEEYDFTPGSKALIRSTEKTVIERLPARIEIRKKVPLEMPHIMVLIEDRKDILMQTASLCGTEKPLYDFQLMKNSGRIKGFFISDKEKLDKIADALIKLKGEARDGMLYAMGDGNHSFAAAKAHWDNIKVNLSPEERENHPARFGLAELVNLYDNALKFEPIHRLLINVDGEQLQKDLCFDADNPPSLQELQPRLDEWLEKHPESEIEYIHGEKECRLLGSKPGNLAVCWKEFSKESLFSDVAKHGVLCRKSFSMGSAPDKRFYLECRSIR